MEHRNTGTGGRVLMAGLSTGTLTANDTTSPTVAGGVMGRFAQGAWEDACHPPSGYRLIHGMSFTTFGVDGSFSQATISKGEQPMNQKKEVPGRRLVQIIIVDPTPECPMEDTVLHLGQMQVTDRTDEELYLELGIKEMLDRHNEKRGEHDLKPIRIHHLLRHVLTVLRF
jgi:hypothetical protein